jgi:prepilin-type processing-associated H-X9-DG protein
LQAEEITMSIRSRLVRWCAAALLAAGFVAVGSGCGKAQASKPAGVALERAMKYAPAGAAGLIHVEVKALVKDVLAGVVKGLEPNAIPAEVVQAANKVAEKTESVDVFLLGSGDGPRRTLASMLLVVVHGALTPADVNEALKAIPNLPPGMTLKKGEKGRYSVENERTPILVLFGGEAPELPAGVVVGGLAPMLTSEFLAGLGKGKNDELAQLLKDVDTAAPIWAAVQMEKIVPAPDAPKTIAGAIYLLGGGKTKIALDFQDAEAAGKFEKETKVAYENGKAILSALEVTREAGVVTIASKTTDPLVPKIAEGFAKARAASRQAVPMANLKSLGRCCMMYAATHGGFFPPDWVTMFKWVFYSDPNARISERDAGLLVSPLSGKKAKVLESGELGFEPDYVCLKYTMLAEAITTPAEMVLAYERPENYKNEKTAVLYVDGHVEILRIDEFQKQLKATQDWIAEHEKKNK